MKLFATILIALAALSPPPAQAITTFDHIVIIVQENRTPDNLFYGLCFQPSTQCAISNQSSYNIQTHGWFDSGGTIDPTAVSLATFYDIGHHHKDWAAMCDRVAVGATCLMDGARGEDCSGSCPTNYPFSYVAYRNDPYDIQAYFTLAKSYGWANYMFETNQGPSFPAHQFLFGATSAPNAEDDAVGTFASENDGKGGCQRTDSGLMLIGPDSVEYPSNLTSCFDRPTISTELESVNIDWKYYTPGSGLWTAPDAIKGICLPLDAQNNCSGPDYVHVIPDPMQVLTDAGGSTCNLAPVSWVIPGSTYSDHASIDGQNTGGPAWVADVVDAIGEGPCWNSTAIVITWDDWGGWYDHVAPPMPGQTNQGGYQYGFRVPLLFVSAYTPLSAVTGHGPIDNHFMDFGAIARFIEHNFGIREGNLGFADNRTCTNCGLYDMSGFYNLSLPPRIFMPIPTHRDAHWFLTHKQRPGPPDDY